jgi:ATP-dependent DNA helicase UvrD/PcrA
MPSQLESVPEERPSRGSADLLGDLNPAQREAVLHGSGPLLILAGAGSGKTRAITRRIAYLVTQRGVAPEQILAITFTNKAAGEMRERVEQLLPPAATEGRGRVWLSTFHSLGARLLRREIEQLGQGYTRDFTIYDTADRNLLLKSLIESTGFDATRYKPALLGAWISEKKNAALGDAELGIEREAAGTGEREAPDRADLLGMDELVFRRVSQAYDEAMRKNNALDFDDLLLKLLELFERAPGLRDLYARRFVHVLVDEYQDTNRVQYRLMRHFASFHHNLAVCGDPDQSIYAWRGADVRNILDFESDFPAAKVVRLEQNYRSTQNILDAAQAVIRKNRMRIDKELWSEKGPGAPLCLTECADEDDEAREIVAQLRGLEFQGIRCDQAAIFYRANFMQRALERALRLATIPYQIVAGTEFYQRREIKDLVAYLRLIVNPQDDEAAKRVINVPGRGIGDRSIELLAQWAQDRRASLLVAAASGEVREQLRGKAKHALEAFGALMARLGALRDAPAAQALAQVLDETKYYEWLDRTADESDVDRAANVDELMTYALDFDRQEPDGKLRGFLQDIALVSDTDSYAASQPKVTLMTLHAAKGLEFPVVFIAGVEDELLPHARAVDEAPRPEFAVEEERRLFYVGMTRAKERLFLTWAQVRRHFGQDSYCRPSRFLAEIPQHLIESGDKSGRAGDGSDLLGEFAPAGPPDSVGSVGGESAIESFSPGEWVEHDHFGRGRVVSLLGRGINARATVDFPQHGQKQLLLAYAKLRRVDTGDAHAQPDKRRR